MIMDFDRRIGRVIRERRIAAGITQQELAASIGVTFQQLQKYEKAANRISASKLDAIASALGTTGAELMRLAAGDAVPEEAAPLARLHMQIARHAAALPDEQARGVLTLLKAMRGAVPAEAPA